MTDSAASTVLVVVVGPQASGKSTASTALAAELHRRGGTAALVERDQVAAMALPAPPDRSTARAIFESVTGRWARAGCTCAAIGD